MKMRLLKIWFSDPSIIGAEVFLKLKSALDLIMFEAKVSVELKISQCQTGWPLLYDTVKKL